MFIHEPIVKLRKREKYKGKLSGTFDLIYQKFIERSESENIAKVIFTNKCKSTCQMEAFGFLTSIMVSASN